MRDRYNPIPNGLVGEWKFDEGTGTTASDSSNGGNHLTLAQGATWAVGKFGSSLSLDGQNDYALAQNVNLGFEGKTEFSLEVWINTTTTMGRIIQKQISDSYNTFILYIYQNRIAFGLSRPNLTIIWYSNAGVLTSGWHHIVGTYKKNAIDITDAKIYLDGVSIVTPIADLTGYTSSFTMNETANNLYFGIRPVNLADPLAGLIDNARIYNRKLSGTEVTRLYNGPHYRERYL
jgi:hypothetical protein